MTHFLTDDFQAIGVRVPGRLQFVKALLGVAVPQSVRMPIRDGKHWLQLEEPERYPLATPAMLRNLFFPTSTQREGRKNEQRAREHLKRMVEAGDVRLVKGRLLPPGPSKRNGN